MRHYCVSASKAAVSFSFTSPWAAQSITQSRPDLDGTGQPESKSQLVLLPELVLVKAVIPLETADAF